MECPTHGQKTPWSEGRRTLQLFADEQRFERIPGKGREKMHRNDHAREKLDRVDRRFETESDGRQQADKAEDAEKEIEDDLPVLFQQAVEDRIADSGEDPAGQTGGNDADGGHYPGEISFIHRIIEVGVKDAGDPCEDTGYYA